MQRQRMVEEFGNLLTAAERGAQQVIAWMNDRAVPSIRTKAVHARHEGARLLRHWADRVDPEIHKHSPGVPH